MWDMIGRISHVNYVKRVPDKVKREVLLPKMESKYYQNWDNIDFYKGLACYCCSCRIYVMFNPHSVYDVMQCPDCRVETNVVEAKKEYFKRLEEEKTKAEIPAGEKNQVVADVKSKIDPNILQYDVVEAPVKQFKKGSEYLCTQTLLMSNNALAFKEGFIYECLDVNPDEDIEIRSEFAKRGHSINDPHYKWGDHVFIESFVEVNNVKYK